MYLFLVTKCPVLPVLAIAQDCIAQKDVQGVPVMVSCSLMKSCAPYFMSFDVFPNTPPHLSPHAHFKGEITPDLVRKTAGLAQIQITEEEVSVKMCLMRCAWLICSFCWRTLC